MADFTRETDREIPVPFPGEDLRTYIQNLPPPNVNYSAALKAKRVPLLRKLADFVFRNEELMAKNADNEAFKSVKEALENNASASTDPSVAHVWLVQLLYSVNVASNGDKEDFACRDLHFAAKLGAVEIAAEILKGAEMEGGSAIADLINIKDATNRTAFYMAARQGRMDTIKFLGTFRPHIDVYAPASSGHSPMTCAVFFGFAETVESLVKDAKCNPKRPDGHGSTPLMIAEERGNEAMADLLRDLISLYGGDDEDSAQSE